MAKKQVMPALLVEHVQHDINTITRIDCVLTLGLDETTGLTVTSFGKVEDLPRCVSQAMMPALLDELRRARQQCIKRIHEATKPG
jgi:hypothetical protein